MAKHYIKDMATGRVTEVAQPTHTSDPDREVRIQRETGMVKRRARREAFAAGISRVEYDSNNRMRAQWEARAVTTLLREGYDLHTVVILAYGPMA